MSKKTSPKKPATNAKPKNRQGKMLTAHGAALAIADDHWKAAKKAEKDAAKKVAAPKAAPPKATTPATEKKTEKKAKAKAEPKDKKLSAIDAAVQVLGASKEPLSTKQMIEAMAAKNLWTSPGGKTPHATLYSAILREINEKGKDARFTKTERGRFTTKT